MPTLLELRPDAIERNGLGALLQVLRPARSAHLSRAPRLVGPDGSEVALPREVIDLLVVVIKQLESGSGVSIRSSQAELDRAPRGALDALAAEAQDLGLYDE